MLTLHIGNKNYSSWSLRPWVLMRELAIPFEERLHPFGDDFSAGVAGLSPTGKVPCLVDGTRIVWDTLAIAEYLAEDHPAVWPADRDARAYARSAAAEMHSSFQALRSQCSMNCGLTIELGKKPASLTADLGRIAALWTMGLERFGGPFLAGPAFTAVDAFFCPVAFRLKGYRLSLGGEADAYAARLLALPAMQDWYAAALLEPYRDAPHEADAKAAGAWLEDRRVMA